MKGEFLTEHISVRVTPKERIQIQEQSEISGLTISEYSRRRICGRRVLSRIEREMIFELRRQGGLMKLIFNESHGMYSDKTANAIDSINSFVLLWLLKVRIISKIRKTIPDRFQLSLEKFSAPMYLFRLIHAEVISKLERIVFNDK